MWDIIGIIILAAMALLGLFAAWDLTDFAPLSDFLEALNINIKRK